MFKIRSALAAMALLAGVAVAHAQTTQQDHEVHHPGGAAAPATPTPPARGSPGMGMGGTDKMMGGDMEQMMRSMMRRMMSGEGMPDMAPMGPHAGIGGLRHIEGQIAFYKAELHITDAQTAQWNAFADTLRAGAKQLQTAYLAMMPGDALPSVTDQLAKRRQLLTAELDSLQSIEPVARTLYDVLSPEQKKLADEMMADHLRRM
jgi:LTXXQ motif family protein